MDKHLTSSCETLAEQYQALLEISEAIAVHRDLPSLFHDLSKRLHCVVSYGHMRLLLHDAERNVMRMQVLEVTQTGELPTCCDLPVEESPGGWVWKTQQPLVLPEVEKDTRFPLVTPRMIDQGVKSFCAVPLTTAQRRLGALGFGSLQEVAYDGADVEFLQQVARQVAVAVDNVLNYESAQAAEQLLRHERDRLRLLLEVNNAVVSRLDLREVFTATTAYLRRVMPYEIASLYLSDPDKTAFRRHALFFPEGKGLIHEGHVGLIDDTPAGPAFRSGKPVLFNEDDLKRLNSDVGQSLLAEGVKSGCCVPLLSHGKVLGTLNVGSFEKGPFTSDEVDLLSHVAVQVAIAVDNALAYQQITELKDKLTREEGYLTQAQRLTGVGSWAWDPSESHNYYSREVFNIFGLEPTKGNPTLADFLRIYHPEDREFIEEAENKLVSEGQGYDVKYRIVRPDGEIRFVREVGTPVRENGVVTGFVGACMDVTDQEQMTQELRREKLYLEDEIRTEYNFEEIIGESGTLKRVLRQVETVAPTDSTVLIQGETGTGKELIARAIHNLSNRRERTFVKINCAAIPSGLLESELFGHERGAFTGAIAQKAGRFELADKGTLFLDEVGDIPLELQSKLLRVLQEQEFERLGSTKTIRVNVRLVAATNRDLNQMVVDKEFRSDLYYRFSVFPIMAPPLRERSADIPLLIRYFAQKYGRRMNKRIESIPAETMATLSQYSWPGNIRELENLIERSVILSQGPDLHVPLGELKKPTAATANGVVTLEAAEREHILRALQEANWVIGGPSGAAARLGMKRTTLQSKIRKLNIARHSSPSAPTF
jgi:formate hydrogenlyase transcriptional activator